MASQEEYVALESEAPERHDESCTKKCTTLLRRTYKQRWGDLSWLERAWVVFGLLVKLAVVVSLYVSTQDALHRIDGIKQELSDISAKYQDTVVLLKAAQQQATAAQLQAADAAATVLHVSALIINVTAQASVATTAANEALRKMDGIALAVQSAQNQTTATSAMVEQVSAVVGNVSMQTALAAAVAHEALQSMGNLSEALDHVNKSVDSVTSIQQASTNAMKILQGSMSTVKNSFALEIGGVKSPFIAVYPVRCAWVNSNPYKWDFDQTVVSAVLLNKNYTLPLLGGGPTCVKPFDVGSSSLQTGCGGVFPGWIPALFLTCDYQHLIAYKCNDSSDLSWDQRNANANVTYDCTPGNPANYRQVDINKCVRSTAIVVGSMYIELISDMSECNLTA